MKYHTLFCYTFYLGELTIKVCVLKPHTTDMSQLLLWRSCNERILSSIQTVQKRLMRRLRMKLLLTCFLFFNVLSVFVGLVLVGSCFPLLTLSAVDWAGHSHMTAQQKYIFKGTVHEHTKWGNIDWIWKKKKKKKKRGFDSFYQLDCPTLIFASVLTVINEMKFVQLQGGSCSGLWYVVWMTLDAE